MRRAAIVLLLALTACASPPAERTFDWEPWGAAAFRRAADERRPILVNVVAEWCHWCHVMDDQTYGDSRVAQLLAERFVTVRVDSDARPDIAERYQNFGWPATAVLTPDARPILERRGYQEADTFLELLRGVVSDLDAGRPIARRAAPPPRPIAARDLVDAGALAEERLDGFYDAAAGGWGRQKYPLGAAVEFVVLRDHLDGTESGRAAMLTTLAGWEQIVDPVWGGLYQYSERGDWKHPHFEKIAAVQAEGIDGFVRAYRTTSDERWLRGARAIERYIAAFLTGDDGRFLTSQDADVGAHDADTPWIDGNDYFPLPDAERRALGVPWIDRHAYADRNGWIITALARLHQATGDETTLARALSSADQVIARHALHPGQTGSRDGFRHAEDDRSGILHLADQVALGRAFLALYESTGESIWRRRAIDLASTVEERFADAGTGALFAHTEIEGAVGAFAERRHPFRENARAARWYLQLHAFTQDVAWRQRAERILRAIGERPLIRRQGRRVSDFALAIRELGSPPVHIAVVGRATDEGRGALHAEALRAWHPNRIVEVLAPGGLYPDVDQPALYVCTANACSAPLDLDDVRAGKLSALLAATR